MRRSPAGLRRQGYDDLLVVSLARADPSAAKYYAADCDAVYDTEY